VAGFTSYTYDKILDLHFAQFRFYDAGDKRFTAEDPVKDGANWYSYCGNSPVMFVDPLGLITIEAFNARAKLYAMGGGRDDYQATIIVAMELLCKNLNPNLAVHNLAQVLLFDQIYRVGGPSFLRSWLEYSHTNPQTGRTNFIDVLAIDGNGMATIYELKSLTEFNRVGRPEVSKQVRTYYNSLKCASNMKDAPYADVILPTVARNYGNFEATILKMRDYEIRMVLEYQGLGIYTYYMYEHNYKTKQKSVRSQAAVANMLRQAQSIRNMEQMLISYTELSAKTATVLLSAQMVILGASLFTSLPTGLAAIAEAVQASSVAATGAGGKIIFLNAVADAQVAVSKAAAAAITVGAVAEAQKTIQEYEAKYGKQAANFASEAKGLLEDLFKILN